MDSHTVVDGLIGLGITAVAKILWDMRGSLSGIAVLLNRVLENDLPHIQADVLALDTKLDAHLQKHVFKTEE